jgi:hypothetical protein
MKRCRDKYYKHREKAIQNPQRFLSIIIDGIEKRKGKWVYIRNGPGSSKEMRLLDQAIYLVKAHGVGNFLYVMSGQVGFGGANCTTEIMHRFLLAQVDAGNKLPPVLYVQLDNCGGDNKNYAFLMYLQNLVRLDVFKKIKVSFLPVGHTHEDVDQWFSRLAAGIRRTGLRSREHLKQICASCFSSFPDRPNVTFIHARHDWASMMEGQRPKHVQGLLSSRVLRFVKYKRVKHLISHKKEKIKLLSETTAAKARLSTIANAARHDPLNLGNLPPAPVVPDVDENTDMVKRGLASDVYAALDDEKRAYDHLSSVSGLLVLSKSTGADMEERESLQRDLVEASIAVDNACAQREEAVHTLDKYVEKKTTSSYLSAALDQETVKDRQFFLDAVDEQRDSDATQLQFDKIVRGDEDVCVHYKREMITTNYFPLHSKGTSILAPVGTWCIYLLICGVY